MSTVLELDDLRDGYVKVVKEILNKGREVSPRGVLTLELDPPTMLIVKDPSKVIPVGVGRRLRLEIGAAESAHLIGGVSDAAQMVSITKNFEQFVEEGRFRGAYGPRVSAQFPRVVDLIKRDRDTRQAGVVIWRPWDLARPSKDVPCTIELHYVLRGGRLDTHVTMRSNDVFWGLPYDAWMFSNAQHAVAYALGVEVGTYYHTAVSLHAYVDKDLDRLNALYPYDGAASPPMFAALPASGPKLSDNVDPVSRWRTLSRYARIAVGVSDSKEFIPASAAWYRDVLEPYRSTGALCSLCGYVLPNTEEYFYFYRGERRGAACRRCRMLRVRGLAPDDYERLLMEQGYACGICGEEKPLVIDHDHTGGMARGLLCRECNVMLGYLEKRVVDWEARVEKYIKKSLTRDFS